jgi:tRNA modification GTPase
LTSEETIAAIATPPGVGGIGIIRVSGPGVVQVARGLLGSLPTPREAKLCSFRAADGEVIDVGIALYFPAPRSFTGDDVLELHGHGGPVVLDRLLARVTALGPRLARPGEFSQRAFLNGRVDLVQAEAIADLIESRTAAAARAAMRTLQGDLSRRVAAVAEGIVESRVRIEACLDFPDDSLELEDEVLPIDEIQRLEAEVAELLERAAQGAAFRDGLTVVIAGAPNVGKSSLMNALAGGDRAIVTPIAGTTRDVLREAIEIGGIPVNLIDTAGLRAVADLVEQEGVRRARREIDCADHVLWVFDDPSSDLCEEVAWRDKAPDTRFTRVRNKIDLAGVGAYEQVSERGCEIGISARTGEGLDLLRQRICTAVGAASATDGQFLARRRHIEALKRTADGLGHALARLADGSSLELIAEDLRVAQHALGEITGELTSEDLLDRIFSSFCIGK